MAAASHDREQFTEQRLQERFSLHLPVRVSAVPEDARGPKLQSLTANISAGGVFITTEKPLPIACRVRLEFQINLEDLKRLRFILSQDSLRRFEGKPVWVKAAGIVIRHEPDGMAVIFEEAYQLSPLAVSE